MRLTRVQGGPFRRTKYLPASWFKMPTVFSIVSWLHRLSAKATAIEEASAMAKAQEVEARAILKKIELRRR